MISGDPDRHWYATIEYPGIFSRGHWPLLSIGSLAIAAADAPRSTALDSPPTAPDGYAWKVIPELSDEFTGTNLDERKWLPQAPDWKGREPSVFDPSNVSVKDGMLQLRNTTRLKTLDGLKNPEKDVWVQSACVSSSRPIASYGYYAARMKASRICMTSSFWFQSNQTEIERGRTVRASPSKPRGEDAHAG